MVSMSSADVPLLVEATSDFQLSDCLQPFLSFAVALKPLVAACKPNGQRISSEFEDHMSLERVVRWLSDGISSSIAFPGSIKYKDMKRDS